MRKYNIYSGVRGKFDARYQVTGLFENEDDALEEAFQLACEEYAQYEDSIYSWDEAVSDYCLDNDMKKEDLNEDDNQEIEEYYNEERDYWIEYYVIPTDEDDIDPDELLFDHSIDDSFSQTDCE